MNWPKIEYVMKADLKSFSYLFCLLIIHSSGYGQTTPEKTDSANHVIEIDAIKFAPESHELKQVEITARKPFVERKDGKLILNVANSPLAAGNSALEILAKAPGVMIDHAGNISFRGPL